MPKGFYSGAVEQLKAGVAAINDAASETGLEKRSADSAWMLDYWDLADDLVTGYKAVKEQGEKYLPRFADENLNDYHNRLNATKFTNIYRDIVESLSAKPFEEEVTLVSSEDKEIPEVIKDLMEDIDGAGGSLTTFAAATFFNGVNSAIDWIFIDYPNIDRSVIRTQADVKREGIRPFWSHVLGRNVLDARMTVINSKEILTYIKILEPGSPDHIRIFERSANGSVNWTLHRKSEKSVGSVNEWILVDSGFITIGIIPLVPFFTGRRDGRSFKFFPMMRDAADLQVELYQQESALKFIKIMAAYPMLCGNGVKPQLNVDGTAKKIAVGPHRVLYGGVDSAGNAGTWGYVEPSASSMTFLASDVKETIAQLRELGRQPLTAQSGNLTTITTAVAAGKSKSAIAACALNLKNALENALVITCMWLSITEDNYSPEVNVYTEFDDFGQEGQDQQSLLSMREKGDLSQETLWAEMKRRKVLAPEFDAETEQQRIFDETPSDGKDNNLDDENADDKTGVVDPLDPKIPADPEA